MTYRAVSFPITLARPMDATILGARMAVADIFRQTARAAVQRSTDAGVDGVTVGRRMVMDYMAACRASRFLRAFPQAVARWCFQTEQHAVQLAGEGYTAAPVMSVGGYGAGWVSLMPSNVVVVRAGGVSATGVIEPNTTGPEGSNTNAIVLHEIREVRLTCGRDLDGAPTYSCTVIMSNDTGQRDFNEDPVEPEPALEPEDQ